MKAIVIRRARATLVMPEGQDDSRPVGSQPNGPMRPDGGNQVARWWLADRTPR